MDINLNDAINSPEIRAWVEKLVADPNVLCVRLNSYELTVIKRGTCRTESGSFQWQATKDCY